MISTAVALAMLNSKLDYPETKTVDHVDMYHGIAVKDPYRWLEQPVSVPEVKAWVDAQNEVTFDYLEQIPGRDRYLQELEKRLNYERFNVPIKRNDRVFYQRNSGLQNQDVLYYTDARDLAPRVLLDPNTLSEDGTVALSGIDFSLDGRRMLYGLSEAGSDWLTWHVMNVDTGETIGSPVKWSKFGGGTINADGTAFYYLRYPEPTGDSTFTASNTEPSIWMHKVGTDQSQDQMVFNLPDNPDWFVYPSLDPAKTHLIIYIDQPGSTNNRIYLKDLSNPDAPITKLFDANDANYTPVHISGSTVWSTTTKDAPKGKVIKSDYRRRIAPVDIIPESQDTLEGASVVGGRLATTYMKDARSAVRIYDFSGKLDQEVQLPGLGSVGGFLGLPGDPETHYSYTDFTNPPTIYHYNVETDSSDVYRQPELPFDPTRYESKQVFVESPDGTKVPMFIVHRKGLELNGNNPTLLYGYGGFNVSQTPWFSTSRTVWLDAGGVWCLANIRGGGEYGKEWHESAIKTKRQNAYDDFIACAEWLVDNELHPTVAPRHPRRL